MPTDPKQSEGKDEVSKWLDANKAGQFKDAFAKKGYTYVVDVTADVIDQIVGKDGGVPGLAATLKRTLQRDDPLKAPQLPPGKTLDLSGPDPKPPDGIEWKLPVGFSVSPGARVISPGELNGNDWMILAHDSEILYGYNMDGPKPNRGDSPVRFWKVPDSQVDFYRDETKQSLTATSLNYTEQTSSYVAERVDTESATASYVFCAASFERSHSERRAGNQYSKDLYLTGLWQYPRATLYLDKCTVTAPKFASDVEDALSDPSEDKQVEKLKDVFDRYGHAVPQVVVLGGQLSFQKKYDAQGRMDTDAIQDTIKAAVEGKAGRAAGSASFSLEEGSSKTVTANSLAESVTFKATGGDTTKNVDPNVWSETVKDPHNWEVIALYKLSDDLGSDAAPRKDSVMISTVDLLPINLRDKVKELWNKVPVPPSILDQEPIDRLSEGSSQVITPKQDAFFYLAIRTQMDDGARGYVNLASGRSADPSDSGDAPDIASTAAYAHWSPNNDIWNKHSGICMPVPAGNYVKLGSYTTTGNSNAQASRVRTTLKFGAWRQAFPTGLRAMADQQHRAESDGFLVVCVWTSFDGPRGGALAFIDGVNVAGASVHNYVKDLAYISAQSFCVPVPAGSAYQVQPHIDVGDVRVRAYWLPIVDDRWMLRKAEKREPDTIYTADASDGILHGWIHGGPGERGSIACYTGPDASAPTSGASYAAASVHYDDDRDKHINWSSVMLPVAMNAYYKVATEFTHGNPVVDLYWTAIVPRKAAP